MGKMLFCTSNFHSREAILCSCCANICIYIKKEDYFGESFSKLSVQRKYGEEVTHCNQDQQFLVLPSELRYISLSKLD